MYKILCKKSFFILANLIYAFHIQAASVNPAIVSQPYVTESINKLANIFADKDVQDAIKEYFKQFDSANPNRGILVFDQKDLTDAITQIKNANIQAILQNPETKLLNFRTTILYKIKTLNRKSYVSTAEQLTALLLQAQTSQLQDDKANLGIFLALNQNLVKDNIKLITEKLGEYNSQDVILVAKNYISENGGLFLPLKKLVSEKITVELNKNSETINTIITLFDNKNFTVADYFKLGNPPELIKGTAIKDIFVNANIAKILTKGTPNLLTIPGVTAQDILSKLFAEVNGETNETQKENLIKFLADKNNAKLVKDNIKLISEKLSAKFTAEDTINFAHMNDYKALFVGPLKNLLYQKINEILTREASISDDVKNQMVTILSDRAVLIDYVKSIKNFLPNSRNTTELNKILDFIKKSSLRLGFKGINDPELAKLIKLADPRTITQKIIDIFKPTIVENTTPPDRPSDDGYGDGDFGFD